MERVVFDKVRKSRRRRWRKKFRNCIQKKHKDLDLVDQTTSATPAKKKNG